MGDFFDQARILAVMYELSHRSDPTKPLLSYSVLMSEEHFKFMEVRETRTYAQISSQE
jgi:hypothetical protein